MRALRHFYQKPALLPDGSNQLNIFWRLNIGGNQNIRKRRLKYRNEKILLLNLQSARL